MLNDRRFLKWCLGQRNGIRIVKPSDNLARAYMKKSRNALKSMEVNLDAGIYEWAISASYYAKYFVVYALFQKIGVKCEIHDCAIRLFSHLFKDHIPPGLSVQLRESKTERIEAQYYTEEISVNRKEMVEKTRGFVLKIEELMDGLNADMVAVLQKKLRDITRPRTG
jgi:uncharacterized protein (UPF0332 family)